LKEQQRENFVVTPVFQVRDLVNDSNDECRNEQRASGDWNVSYRNKSHNNPDTRAFNQRGNGGDGGLRAEAAQRDVIFNQGEKNGQQQEGKAKRHERKPPKFQNV